MIKTRKEIKGGLIEIKQIKVFRFGKEETVRRRKGQPVSIAAGN
jgi:hypothetical protein